MLLRKKNGPATPCGLCEPLTTIHKECTRSSLADLNLYQVRYRFPGICTDGGTRATFASGSFRKRPTAQRRIGYGIVFALKPSCRGHDGFRRLQESNVTAKPVRYAIFRRNYAHGNIRCHRWSLSRKPNNSKMQTNSTKLLCTVNRTCVSFQFKKNKNDLFHDTLPTLVRNCRALLFQNKIVVIKKPLEFVRIVFNYQLNTYKIIILKENTTKSIWTKDK